MTHQHPGIDLMDVREQLEAQAGFFNKAMGEFYQRGVSAKLGPSAALACKAWSKAMDRKARGSWSVRLSWMDFSSQETRLARVGSRDGF